MIKIGKKTWVSVDSIDCIEESERGCAVRTKGGVLVRDERSADEIVELIRAHRRAGL